MSNKIFKKMIMDSPIPYCSIKGIKQDGNKYINLKIIDANQAFLNLSQTTNIDDLKNTSVKYLKDDKPILKLMNKNFIEYNSEDKATYETYDEILDKYYNVNIYNLGNDVFWIEIIEVNTDRVRLSNILNNSPFATWIKDVEGKYIDVNEKFTENSGKLYSEVIGKTDADLWGKEEAHIYELQDKDVLKTFQTKTYTEIIKFAKDNKDRYYETTKWPYLDKNNNVIGVMGITLEIVDNVELRQNLKENEKKFKEIVNYSEEAFFIIENKKMTYVSPSFKKIFGKSPDILLGDLSNWNKYIDQDEVKKIDYDFKNPTDRVVKITDTNGCIKWIWVKLVPIKDERGNTIKTIGIISDVSKQKEVELEIEKMRMEFFGNLSHELRTPINLILGTMQLLNLKIDQLNYKEKDYLIRYNKIVTQNGLRLLKLVNNLIDSTKINTGYFEYNPQNYDIIKFIEDICMSVCDFANQQDIDLIFDTELEENLMTFDLDMIERIVLNLLSNAIKFNKKNGTIEVYINKCQDGYLNIGVKDSGIGIPKEKIDSIFGRFDQVKNKSKKEREGSGIGLSLVKSLVELHNGTISVNSNLNEGTEFIISIPNILIESNKNNIIIESEGGSQVNRMNVEFSDIYM
ncbi:MAG: PAS domain-containing sensor histidine kinase [Paraclostridium sp.]